MVARWDAAGLQEGSGPSRLDVVNPDGSDVASASRPESRMRGRAGPYWSPDGTLIAFTAGRGGVASARDRRSGRNAAPRVRLRSSRRLEPPRSGGRTMRTHYGRWLALAAVLTLGACTSAREADAPAPAVPVSSTSSVTAPSDAATPTPGTEGSAFPIEAFADISEDPVSKKEAAEFQAILDDMASFDGAGMSATVMTADGTWSGATGSADGVRDVRVDSQFGIASITKSVIAAQVMQMVEAGELSLDAPATDYLPANFDFDTNGATIRQLLEMHAGIPDWYTEDMEERVATHRRRDWEPAEVLALVGPDRAPADEEFVYADTNYTLLGLVIEHVRGRPLVDVLRHGVLRVDGTERLVYQPDEAPTATDGHAGRRVTGRAREGRRLPPIPLRCELGRSRGRHRVGLDRRSHAGGVRSAPARSFRRPR